MGSILSTVLYGATLSQTWFYFWHYRTKDPMALKCFVTALLILDTVHTILCIYSVYWYLILNFGNVDALDFNMWATNSQVDINSLIGFLVQLFYARRVHIISNNIVLPVIVVVLGGLSFILGFVFSVKAAQLQRFSRYSSLTWVTCVGMSSAALSDILIALSMCWCLYHKKTGLSKSDSTIMTLMSYSVSTGLLTSILATGTLVSFLVSPSGLFSLAFLWPMGKCYVNSFLAILNNRVVLRDRSSDHDTSSFAISIRLPNSPYKTGPSAVGVTVPRPATADDSPRREHDCETGLHASTQELD